MITIHHLGVSQSDRVVWLMEELGLPNTKAYVERVSARPAYQKAMEIAGPAATNPGS